MDPSLFKTAKSQRGFTYSYFWSPPLHAPTEKPTLLFAHGFPEGSYLWRHQVPFFQRLGYGVLVPEFLGYGGTDKPTDISVYTGSGHAQDIVDILDAEGLDKVVIISHDWGVYPASRLLNYHPHRISACAFLAVGYQPPFAPGQDLISQYEAIKEKMGYDAFAYQRFFIQPDAAEIIERNIDSFICLSFPPEPSFWLETECVEGVARSFVESGRITELPAYITPKDKEHLKTALLNDGMAGRLCWYKAMAEQVIAKDDANIPDSSSSIPHPFLFVACTHDVLFLPANEDAVHAKYVKGPLTRRQLEGAGHWGAESHREEFNRILVEWLEGLEKDEGVRRFPGIEFEP